MDESGSWPAGGGETGALVRAMDWPRTPLGPMGQWPQSLRTAVQTVLDLPFPAVVLWGPALVQVYNDGYRGLMAEKHPAGLGQPTRECWPEVWHINEPLYRRVRAGESLSRRDALYPITRSGTLEDAWFTLSYSPLRDEAGAVAGVLVTVSETTTQVLEARQRARAEAALRESEARYRTLATASADVIYRMGPDWSEMRQLDGRGFLSDTAEPSGSWLERYIHPDDRARVTSAIERAVRDRGVFELEHRVVRADGTLGWTFSRAVPMLDAKGGIVEWIGAASDMTARREAEAALRESEARASALIDMLPGSAAFVVDPAMRYQLAKGEALRDGGFSGDRFVGNTVEEAVGPALAAEYAPNYQRALDGEPFEAEHAAHGRTFLTRGTPLRDGAGRVTAALVISVDVTAQQAARAALRASEERQAFLVRLGDALRPLDSPAAIQAAAARLLGQHLRVDRASYAEVEGEPGAEMGTLREQYVREGGAAGPSPAPFPRRYPYAQFGEHAVASRRRGEVLVVADVDADPAFDPETRAAWAAGGVRAAVVVPLVKAGRFVAEFGVQAEAARAWASEDVALVQEVAERTWGAAEGARAEAALRESEERYRTLFETMTQGYALNELVRDAHGGVADVRLLELNPAFERLLGVPVAVARGRTAREVVPLMEDWWFETSERIVRTGEPVRMEHELAALGRWYEVSLYPGGGDRFSVLYDDITARKAAELALRESEAKYSAAFDAMDEGFCIMELVRDADGEIVDLVFRESNPAFARNAGLSDVTGRTVRELLPTYGAHWIETYTRVARTGAAERVENYVRDVDRWFSVFFSRVGGEESRYVAVLFADITERKRAEAALREVNEALERRVATRTAELVRADEGRRQVLRQLVTAEEDERRRLSRELHDSLGQLVTGLLLGLKTLPRGQDGLSGPIADLERLADRIAREMQHMAVQLRPPALDNLGLRLALQAHLEEWGHRYGIEADFHSIGVDGERFPAEMETTLYRVVQEGLNNVVKHAGATRVGLVLEHRGGMVGAILEDDGRGFEVESTLASPEKARRLGLRGMRERVALLGGEMEIESGDGAGTTLYVRIPLPEGA